MQHGKDQRQGDERQVPDDDVYEATDLVRLDPSDVGAGAFAHPGVLGDPWVKLVMPDVQGDDVGGVAFQEHLGEATGGGTHIETPAARDA